MFLDAHAPALTVHREMQESLCVDFPNPVEVFFVTTSLCDLSSRFKWNGHNKSQYPLRHSETSLRRSGLAWKSKVSPSHSVASVRSLRFSDAMTTDLKNVEQSLLINFCCLGQTLNHLDLSYLNYSFYLLCTNTDILNGRGGLHF